MGGMKEWNRPPYSIQLPPLPPSAGLLVSLLPIFVLDKKGTMPHPPYGGSTLFSKLLAWTASSTRLFAPPRPLFKRQHLLAHGLTIVMSCRNGCRVIVKKKMCSRQSRCWLDTQSVEGLRPVRDTWCMFWANRCCDCINLYNSLARVSLREIDHWLRYPHHLEVQLGL